MIVTVAKHGWATVRAAVFVRDEGCIATNRKVFGDDVAPDMCANRFGSLFASWVTLSASDMEFDHVKEEVGMTLRGADDEAHGISVCPWHHRLSRAWRSDSKEHRAVERDWLRQHYPTVWP